MQLHIHATKQGYVTKTILINGNKIYETDKKCIWEGEYAQIGNSIYSLEWAGYVDHKTSDQFIYELCEIKPVRNLDFILSEL